MHSREKCRIFLEKNVNDLVSCGLFWEKKTGYVIFVTYRSFVVFGEFVMVGFSVKELFPKDIVGRLSVVCRPTIFVILGTSVSAECRRVKCWQHVLFQLSLMIFFLQFYAQTKTAWVIKREKTKHEQSYPVNNIHAREVVLEFLSAFILLFQQSLPSLPTNDVIPSHDRAPSCGVLWYGSQR